MTAKDTHDTAVMTDGFTKQAKGGSSGIFHEYKSFLSYHRKWWLAPIIVVLLLAGIFVMLSGTVVAPLIYTLF